MIRLGLRLTLRGGRDAAVRLAIIAVAVAVGVTMLLMALAGVNAVRAQNERYAWLNAAFSPETVQAAGPAAVAGSGVDPVWWLLRGDHVDGQLLGRVDVAATGARSPVPPGMPRLPGPGEYYASPALTRILASTPAAELADRFPGRQIGTIGPEGLPSPNSLIVVVGHDPAELSKRTGVDQVISFSTARPGACDCYSIGINAGGMALILAVVAGALLFPVLIFIGAASRLSAARREERFAAMRLIGATPRQITVISTVEATVAAAVGVVLGFVLYLVLRGPFATIPLTGERFFPHDVSLGPLPFLVVGIGVPAAAAVAARLALRRVQISPLGVTRRATPPRQRAYRMIPLLAGIAELAVFLVIGRPSTTDGQIAAAFAGFVLVMAGLVIAGPWMTMLVSQVVARRAGRPAALIAGRRLSDNPQAAFRAISGLVLALFVTSASAGLIATWDARRGTSRGDTTAHDTLVADMTGSTRPGVPGSAAPVPAATLAALSSVPGVRGVTVVHTNPLGTTIARGRQQQLTGLVSRADLERTPSLGRCEAGAEVAAIIPFGDRTRGDEVWAGAAVPPAQLDSLPILSVVVATDGTAPAIDRARTILVDAYPDEWPASTVAEDDAESSKLNEQYEQLASVVILLSLPIAGCSLAASVAGGLNDRRRPFSLLRLSGTPLSLLRRVVALESAVPLLIGAAVATGAGFLAADLFLRWQLQYTLQMPGLQYALFVVAGLAASLGIIATTLPWLARITSAENARNE